MNLKVHFKNLVCAHRQVLNINDVKTKPTHFLLVHISLPSTNLDFNLALRMFSETLHFLFDLIDLFTFNIFLKYHGTNIFIHF